MVDQEKRGAASRLSHSLPDRFGVSWGEKLTSFSSDYEKPDKKIVAEYYSCFYLEGTQYCLNDTVSIQSKEGLPYIGKIANLYQQVGKTEKQMRVRWFCRSSELPEGLAEVDYSAHSKYVFLMYGEGARNVIHPASTIKKCTILCTAEEVWNPRSDGTPVLEIASADHLFDRAFDSKSGRLMSLTLLLNIVSVYYLTGLRSQISAPVKSNEDQKRRALGSSEIPAANDIFQSRAVSGRLLSKSGNSKGKKRVGLDSSSVEVEKAIFKRPKLRHPGDDPSKFPKEISKPADSKLIPVSPPCSEFEAANLPESSRSTNDSRWKQMQGLVEHQDEKGASLDDSGTPFEAGHRESQTAGNLNVSIVEDVPNVTQTSTKPHPMRENDDGMASKVRGNKSAADNNKPLGKTFGDELDRGQLSKHVSVPGVHASPPINRKLSASKDRSPDLLGKMQREEGLSRSSSKKRLLSESALKIKAVDSRPTLPGVGKRPPSVQRTGMTLSDGKLEGTWDQGTGRRRVGPDLDIGAPKIRSTAGSGTKVSKELVKSRPLGSKSNTSSHLDKNKHTLVSKLRDEATGALTTRNETMAMPSSESQGRALGYIAGQGSTSRQQSKSSSGGVRNELRSTEANKRERTGDGDGRAVAHDLACSYLKEDRQELREPKKKFFKITWEMSISGALSKKKVLLLQNLDPWFSSSEIEVMLEELLREPCDVRMLPPKTFTCYTSGEALVMFANPLAAEGALRIFTENWVIWSKDERPVLASLAEAQASKSTYVHGFFNTDKLGPRKLTSEEKISAVATSHCSQPNTMEYEMGLQWRLLQDRQTKAWNIAAQEHKLATDQLALEVKQKGM